MFNNRNSYGYIGDIIIILISDKDINFNNFQIMYSYNLDILIFFDISSKDNNNELN